MGKSFVHLQRTDALSGIQHSLPQTPAHSFRVAGSFVQQRNLFIFLAVSGDSDTCSTSKTRPTGTTPSDSRTYPTALTRASTSWRSLSATVSGGRGRYGGIHLVLRDVLCFKEEVASPPHSLIQKFFASRRPRESSVLLSRVAELVLCYGLRARLAPTQVLSALDAACFRCIILARSAS